MSLKNSIAELQVTIVNMTFTNNNISYNVATVFKCDVHRIACVRCTTYSNVAYYVYNILSIVRLNVDVTIENATL